MTIQSQILDTISRVIPEPRFRPSQAIGQAEVMFNDKLDQTLTNVTGQPRLERLKTQNPVTAYRMLKQPYKETYDGFGGPGEIEPQFFTDDPDVLETYNPIGGAEAPVQTNLEYLDESGTKPNALPAQLDLGNVLVVDAPNQHWNRIQYETISDPSVVEILARDGWDVPKEGSPPAGNGINYGTSTDAIVQAAQELGYDSVHFKGLIDLGGYTDYKGKNEGRSNIYAVINPTKIRAQTAMGDPRKRNENNILAELGLGIGAAGGAAAAAGNQDILDTIS